MNREDLQELSRLRIREAKVLLDNKFYDGAYYLCGYSVECALKACIAKNTKRYDFPNKDVANKSFTHNLVNLIKVAELGKKLDDEIKNDKNFELNWAVVRRWSEESRYKRNSNLEAFDLYSAITDRKHGVLNG